MGRLRGGLVVVAVVLAVACSSNGGDGTAATAALTCPAGFDGGASGGTNADEGEGVCETTVYNGTVPNGGACMQDSDCMPTCCACPGGSGRSATVVLCNKGTCVVGPDVCCYWIAPAEAPDGGGVPYACNHG